MFKVLKENKRLKAENERLVRINKVHDFILDVYKKAAIKAYVNIRVSEGDDDVFFKDAMVFNSKGVLVTFASILNNEITADMVVEQIRKRW